MLKNAITRFLENNMKLDGRIDGEDYEVASDGEFGGIGERMVRTTHSYSLLFFYMLFLSEVCASVVFVAMSVAGVWADFHPRPLGMLSAIEEQGEGVASNEHRARVQQACYHKQCPILLL